MKMLERKMRKNGPISKYYNCGLRKVPPPQCLVISLSVACFVFLFSVFVLLICCSTLYMNIIWIGVLYCFYFV